MKEFEFEVAGKTYSGFHLGAFETAQHFIALKNLFAGALSKGLDGDFAELLRAVDSRTLNDVIFPILLDCGLVCTSEKIKLVSAEGMNKIFTYDTIDDFFAVVGKVLALNFAPLIKKTLSRFGLDLDQVDFAALGRDKLQAALQSNGEKTS